MTGSAISAETEAALRAYAQVLSPGEADALVADVVARADSDAAARDLARRLACRHLPVPQTGVLRRRSTCEQTPEVLGARAAHVLGDDDVARLDRHLESCPGCRALAARFEAAERAWDGAASQTGQAEDRHDPSPFAAAAPVGELVAAGEVHPAGAWSASAPAAAPAAAEPTVAEPAEWSGPAHAIDVTDATVETPLLPAPRRRFAARVSRLVVPLLVLVGAGTAAVAAGVFDGESTPRVTTPASPPAAAGQAPADQAATHPAKTKARPKHARHRAHRHHKHAARKPAPTAPSRPAAAAPVSPAPAPRRVTAAPAPSRPAPVSQPAPTHTSQPTSSSPAPSQPSGEPGRQPPTQP